MTESEDALLRRELATAYARMDELKNEYKELVKKVEKAEAKNIRMKRKLAFYDNAGMPARSSL